MCALWLALSGHYSFSHKLLLFLGLGSALLVTYLAWRMDLLDEETAPINLTGRTLLYVPWLAWQVVLSSLDMLRRSLRPTLDIDPLVLTIEGSQHTDLGLVTYANSITLTPGTASIDSDAESHTITVHAIHPDVAAALRSGAMDRRVRAVEGRQASVEDNKSPAESREA